MMSDTPYIVFTLNLYNVFNTECPIADRGSTLCTCKAKKFLLKV